MNKYIVDLVLKDAVKNNWYYVKDYRKDNQWLVYDSDYIDLALIEFSYYEFKVVSYNNGHQIYSTHADLLEAINKIKEMK